YQVVDSRLRLPCGTRSARHRSRLHSDIVHGRRGGLLARIRPRIRPRRTGSGFSIRREGPTGDRRPSSQRLTEPFSGTASFKGAVLLCLLTLKHLCVYLTLPLKLCELPLV